MPTFDNAEIERRAHMIWEREGRPHGRDLQHYYDAMAELDAEHREVADQSSSPPGGISSVLQPGGTASAGSLGTGGAATGGSSTGSARRRNSQ